jgi:hypothetical protein
MRGGDRLTGRRLRADDRFRAYGGRLAPPPVGNKALLRRLRRLLSRQVIGLGTVEASPNFVRLVKRQSRPRTAEAFGLPIPKRNSKALGLFRSSALASSDVGRARLPRNSRFADVPSSVRQQSYSRRSVVGDV